MNREQQAVLELKQIHKSFAAAGGRLKVLAGLSLRLYHGEIVALVGPSGCGKTTLLNIIAGQLRVDRGELDKSPELRTAYVFQEPRLLPWKTVEANIALVQQNFLTSDEARDFRSRLLEETGLAAYKDAYPLQLSGGQRQRLELVRALAVRPQLLLMDEPFQSVDLALRHQLQKLVLEEQTSEQFSILLVTHSPEEAVLLADRVLILSDKPAVILREFTISTPRPNRSYKNEEIALISEEILRAGVGS